jgi:hypothetical protein
MRLLELIEGDDGKLDEQAALSIIFGLVLVALTVFVVVVRGVAFDPLTYAGASATFLGGSMGSLTLRSRFAKGNNDAANPDQPAG